MQSTIGTNMWYLCGCLLPGVLYDGDHVGPLLGHVEQIPPAPVGELHGVDHSLWADYVTHVADCGAVGSPQARPLPKLRKKTSWHNNA